MKKHLIAAVLCLLAPVLAAQEKENSSVRFVYRTGDFLNAWAMRGVDSAYIGLPEFGWRAAFTAAQTGIHSNYTAKQTDVLGDVILQSTTTPSVDLGFHASYRALGFGYSWDPLNAYSNRLNFSLGSKMLGLEFSRKRCTNLRSALLIPSMPDYRGELSDNEVHISHTNLTVWYALNSSHYSHNAATKQGYIQRKTAGSLLINASYTATSLSLHDSLNVLKNFLHDINQMQTHQVSVGLGYGINYTPNQGKVLLHLSGLVQLVCFSINQIAFAHPDSVPAFATPNYIIYPKHPVHVSGTMRGGVSWEINRWVHLSAWAQADNVRFNAATENAHLDLSNWIWQAHLNIGVRFGVPKKRPALSDAVAPALPSAASATSSQSQPAPQTSSLPQWVSDYFFSIPGR